MFCQMFKYSSHYDEHTAKLPIGRTRNAAQCCRRWQFENKWRKQFLYYSADTYMSLFAFQCYSFRDLQRAWKFKKIYFIFGISKTLFEICVLLLSIRFWNAIYFNLTFYICYHLKTRSLKKQFQVYNSLERKKGFLLCLMYLNTA